jgi:hypothetical protein
MGSLEKLTIDGINQLIEIFHPNYIKENRPIFILLDKTAHECDTFLLEENDVQELEELLLTTYSSKDYNLHLYKVEQDDKLDIDYLIEKGYITKDNLCPIKFIPVEDRKFNSNFRIRAKFLLKK